MNVMCSYWQFAWRSEGMQKMAMKGAGLRVRAVREGERKVTL